MKRYESYKDSGVKWLGEIPGHWEVKRLGSYFIERRVKVSDTEYSALSVTKNGIFPQLDNVAKTNDGDNRKLVKVNDFVINSRSDRKGSSGISPLDGSVSLINIVLKPRKTIYPPFCNYLLKSIAFIEEYYRNGRGIVADLWTTRYDEMKIIKMAMPPISEQTAIANYLDSVTSKIDEAISQQQKMIDLLNERKQIIIQNAVTKGLDPNAKMKDSGVEWIGEIPEDWEILKLKRIAKIYTGKTPSTSNPKYFDSEDINWFTPGDFDSYELKDSKRKISKTSIYEKACYIYPQNSIYLIGIGGTIGKVAFCQIEASCNQQINVIIPNFSAYFKYIYYILQNSYSEIMKNANLSTLPIINQQKTGDLLVVLPKIDKQINIVEHIDEKINPIDSSISQCNKMISLLQERKQIIINDVVTGKVKVI